MISLGHFGAWDYTPRQLSGFLFIARRRQQREDARRLAIGTSAARGEPKAVRRQIAKMEKDL